MIPTDAEPRPRWPRRFTVPMLVLLAGGAFLLVVYLVVR